MSAQTVDRPSSGSVETMLFTLGAGIAFGALVSVTAFLLARYGPDGDSWSFRGNGALAAYSLIPALLAGGWTALVMHQRGRPWLTPGLAAAAVGIALAVLDAALLPVFGRAGDQIAGPVLLLALAAWSVVAPAGAALLNRASTPGSRPVITSIAAAGLWVVGLAAGVVLIGIAIPAGS
ncbi:MAG TPA: hypothetical protein VFL29_04620 [Candidatus Dormibacteraeota bacterium]|nr:hypothetical protein [Candidatus Dormibacteraeota bacterium]